MPQKNQYPNSDKIISRLRQRDKRSLFVFAIGSFLLVWGGEWAAFHLRMVERYGIELILIRAAIYISLSVLLWAILLNNDRHRIGDSLRRSEDYFQSLLYAYEEALGLKDSYTGGHGRRVARYSRVISNLLELSNEQSTRVEQAALLHDIGKIGVPDAVLTKPGSLTSAEWEFIRVHPIAGAELLDKIVTLKDLALIVRGHHERYNGDGYPDHLSGEDIPFEARIIAIADTLDAITTTRSYSFGASFEKAVAELEKSTGTYFDPKIMARVLTSEGRHTLELEFGILKKADD